MPMITRCSTVVIHVGIDDTDSLRMGCTTYVAALLTERLKGLGVELLDYPNLIRLNPNVPWKTRGNGATCLRVKADEALVDELVEETIDVVERNSDLENEGTDPGMVFFFGELVPEAIKDFAKQAIQGVVSLKQALKLIKAFKAEAVGFKRSRGIIGALASIGETLEGRHTYELIAYRTAENRGKPRMIDIDSVKEMDKRTYPETFNNVDPETGRVLITPRGPDPVLYGIRGMTPEAVERAHEMIKALEPVERWIIFRTNQGTDAHLRRVESVKELRPFHSIILKGVVTKGPRAIPRRHVVFTIGDGASEVDCAAYEQTGVLRRVAQDLIVGDIVEVYGGVKPASKKRPLTVNLEKLRIMKLASKLVLFNPTCPNCGKRMESAGLNKGFRCRKCSFYSIELKKIVMEEKRNVKEGLYVIPPRSQRHLSAPLHLSEGL